MTITCKAAILRQTGAPAPYAESRPISVEEITLDPPGPMEALVKIAGGGLCHSDLSVINGTRAKALPIALGHEGAGEVVEVGSAITDIKVGDPVVFQFSGSCGRCRRCQEGRPQNCEVSKRAGAKGEMMSGGKRIRDADGNPVSHHSGVSCFSEYAVLDRGSMVVVDRDVSLANAAVFGCAVMTGVGAVINTARIRPGDTVAVIGLGGVGLSGVMGARLGGAEQIIAIDLDERKFDRALELGATHAFKADDPEIVTKVRDLTHGGVDFAVDLAGAVPAIELGYRICSRGGAVVSAGLAPAGATFAIEQADLVSQEKSILGSYMGSCVPVRDIPRFIELHRQGRLPVDRLIDRTVTFDEINEGFDRLATGETIRQILIP
jgi:alcohol dehydrogenase